VDALDLHVEQRVRADLDAGLRRMAREALLVRLLDGPEALAEGLRLGQRRSSRSRSRSFSQPLPRCSSSSAVSLGLAARIQRRGVTPLVTLTKRPGKYSSKSRKIVWRTSVECSSATPLTLREPTVASQAMRTRRPSCPDSSTIDMRRRRSLSPG
jgi:hypothetical protein